MATYAHQITPSGTDAPDIPLAPGIAQREHAVHLYESTESLCKNVADFICDGFAKGQPGLIIATAEHLAGIARELQSRQIDCEAMKKNGQLVEVDADEMLRKIAPGSDLDTQLSLRVLGNLISELAASANAGVVAYGEMVDLLWQGGTVCCRDVRGGSRALLDHVCSEHSLCVPSAAYLA
jgi:hypothetical protein